MKIEGKSYKTIWFENNLVKIIDQTKLPHKFVIKDLKNVKDAINAIKSMEVRGAPLIGATAAYGLVLSIIEKNDLSFLKKSSEELIASRPTAINLKWAVDRMMKKLNGINEKDILKIALDEAKAIKEEDEGFCKNIGLNGLKIIEEISNKKKDTVNILTHCNAGWLATIDWGTATSPIYHAHQKGIKVHVWVDETRPRNQGANLTSYELNEEGISNTVITDNAGGILMQRGQVDMCIVGTDRTLSNGDVCNKIGTYLKALSAKDNNVPFYVALPSSTIDWGTATSPIYHAHQKGIKVHVWVDETRPRNQGANLTSYELNEEGISNTVITDNAGGILMQRGQVDICIVGTDRTLSNGDVCNKIGTYLKALSAKDNNVPFYVALPSSTIDWSIKDHKQIPIEERNSEELSHVEGIDENNEIKKVRIYPQKSKSLNLAFDVTPAKLVTGLITEKGICEASEKGLKGLFK